MRPKASVLFDMRSINSSSKPQQADSEKCPSTPNDEHHASSECSNSTADDNFSWHLGSDQKSISDDDDDDDDDVDDDEPDRLNTCAILSMLEGSFISFNAIRKVFDITTSRLIKTEVYHAKSTIQRSRSEELHRYRQTAASVYYNSLLWHSKSNPAFIKQDQDICRWLFAVQMQSPTGQIPNTRVNRHNDEKVSGEILSSPSSVSIEENTPYLDSS